MPPKRKRAYIPEYDDAEAYLDDGKRQAAVLIINQTNRPASPHPAVFMVQIRDLPKRKGKHHTVTMILNHPDHPPSLRSDLLESETPALKTSRTALIV
ncbi:hypothetical protein FRC00_006946 [Tulasnella sp. 408]|nr:hypothetical protein FRC00_006946 [Tulasnella sp. 408]